MSRFLRNVLLTSLAILMLFSALGWGMNYFKWLTKFSNAEEVYHSIFLSKVKKKVKILIFGDSVCGQLYARTKYNADIYSIACSQATTLAGQYFLLNNFIKNNTDALPDSIILIYTPFSFQNNLDKFSFSYFLKPFYNHEYIDLFDAELKMAVKDVPYYYLSDWYLVRFSNFSSDFSSVSDNRRLLSPISERYLDRIISLCQFYHIKFILEPAPVKKEFELQVCEFYIDVDNALLQRYMNDIVFYPDSLFIDNVHFYNQHIPVDFLNLETSDSYKNN